MPDDPLLRSESEYPSDSGTPMLEAELHSIVAAQVVDEKLMRRNVCLLIIGLNLLLVAGLGAGGYCLISEECKRELIDDAQNLSIPSSSSNLNYDCNVQMEVICQNTAGAVCSEVKRIDLSPENATATANECQDDFRYNKSILNLEEVSTKASPKPSPEGTVDHVGDSLEEEFLVLGLWLVSYRVFICSDVET